MSGLFIAVQHPILRNRLTHLVSGNVALALTKINRQKALMWILSGFQGQMNLFLMIAEFLK